MEVEGGITRVYICVGGSSLLWVGQGGGLGIIDRLLVLEKTKRGCTHSSWGTSSD